MPYVIPSMPLNCNIWHNWQTTVNVYATPDVTCKGCLSPGKRVMVASLKSAGGPDQANGSMELLLPPLTDVRMAYNSKACDVIECPAGSGRIYFVEQVDDIGKGFANEHRYCIMRMSIKDTLWSGGVTVFVPIPLP